MDPLFGGLISGAANLAGSIFSSSTSAANTAAQLQSQQQMQLQSENYNAEQAQLGRDFAANQSQIARDYQTQMSNTAYQRASKDMIAAGLNPMMMFGSGGPASSPGGVPASGPSASVGTPSVPMPQTKSPLAGLGPAVDQVINSAINVKTFDRLTQEIANLRSEQGLIEARTVTEGRRPEQVSADTLVSQTQAAKEGNLMPQYRLTGKLAEDIMGLPESWRQNVVRGGFLGRNVNDLISPLLNAAVPLRRLLAPSYGPRSDSFDRRFYGE